MPQYGTWLPYEGWEATRLAGVLLAIAIGLGVLGFRLRKPLAVRRSGWIGGSALALLWLLGIMTFGVGAVTYFDALVGKYGRFTPPSSPITPVTLISGLIAFVAILVLNRRSGWKVALGSAVLGMLAAPMIFELPFDLMVMGRLYPTPPDPTLRNTLLYFLPLFIIAVAGFGLLTVSPLLRLSKVAVFCLAGMFLVFAVWAALGFGYPSRPLLVVLNAIGKVLAFGAAVGLLLPGQERSPAQG